MDNVFPYPFASVILPVLKAAPQMLAVPSD